MDTEQNPGGSSAWIELSNAQIEHEKDQQMSRQTTAQTAVTNISHLTITSSTGSDSTHRTTETTANSSIKTTPSHVQQGLYNGANRRSETDLRQQYEQHPEKVPDVAAEMEKWYAMTDRYGFLEENTLEYDSAKAKEVERAEKWASMSKMIIIHDENAHEFVLSRKFKRRVYKGVPDCWRREAWYFLSTDCLRKVNDDYKLKTTYQELLQKDTVHEHQIDLDIPRTLRDHIMFKQRYGSGQRALFNVLRAFALYDEEVGYCQGMTNIVATILMYCEEERAFLILVHMFLRDNLHNLFIPGFPALMESFYIQEALLRRYLPKLFNHLTDLGLSSDIYATRWYITLFAGGVVNYHTLLRIWDVYFLCGFDIFFIVAVTLLKTYESRLMAADMDGCMGILGSRISVPNDDKFMKTVQKLYEKNESNDTIKRLRQEYQSNN